jgi:hypothetical protein
VCVSVCERESVCVYVCVRERERECVCVRERERERSERGVSPIKPEKVMIETEKWKQ